MKLIDKEKEVDLEKEVEEYIRKEFTSAEPPDEFLTTVMQLMIWYCLPNISLNLVLMQGKENNK